MRRRSTTLVLALVATTLFVGQRPDPGAAQGPARDSVAVKAVVELFTSQGCSSCPAADALLHEFSSTPGVIALTLPVDYWDYLGWRDTLASSANSERQRAMAKARGDGMIFTPQMVVNGIKYVNGNRRADLIAAIGTVGAELSRVPMRLASTGQTLHLDISASAVDAGVTGADASVLIGAVQSHAEVKVRGGENGGRKLTYANVVHEFHQIGLWKRQALSLDVERASVMRKDAEGCVAILQEGGTGRIISASLLPSC